MTAQDPASYACEAARYAPADWLRLASPSTRRPMSTLVERLGAPVRAVARSLEADLARRSDDLVWAQAPRAGGLGYSLATADVGRRAAWWLLGQWLCAYALGAIDPAATLLDAEEWFYGGGAPLDRQRLAPRGGFVPLEATPAEAWSLLPYLLDPTGQGTRRQVLDSDAHRPDHEHRKKNGVYYTPADVAHFMARAVMQEGTNTLLDPACGSGVFLRAGCSRSIPPSRGSGSTPTHSRLKWRRSSCLPALLSMGRHRGRAGISIDSVL